MNRIWMLVLIPCLAAASCATTFPYKWYGLGAESYQGKLLGPKPADDLPLTVCEPDAQQQGKCVVYLVDEHARLQAKYLELEERLKACEDQQKLVQ